VDQEDQGDPNPPWWTRTGFYILLMQTMFQESDHTSQTIDLMRLVKGQSILLTKETSYVRELVPSR